MHIVLAFYRQKFTEFCGIYQTFALERGFRLSVTRFVWIHTFVAVSSYEPPKNRQVLRFYVIGEGNTQILDVHF